MQHSVIVCISSVGSPQKGGEAVVSFFKGGNTSRVATLGGRKDLIVCRQAQ